MTQWGVYFVYIRKLIVLGPALTCDVMGWSLHRCRSTPILRGAWNLRRRSDLGIVFPTNALQPQGKGVLCLLTLCPRFCVGPELGFRPSHLCSWKGSAFVYNREDTLPIFLGWWRTGPSLVNAVEILDAPLLPHILAPPSLSYTPRRPSSRCLCFRKMLSVSALILCCLFGGLEAPDSSLEKALPRLC